MSESTCRALCYSGADCLSSVRTYLPGTVLQWCRLFNHRQNLLAGHCVAGVQTVKALSEPTCRALCYSGAGCLSGVRTYLPGIVLQWCRLFKQYQNLPAGHCVTVVQAVLAMSEYTCRTLCYSDAGCLSGVGVYLQDTVLQWCRLFKRCQNLPAGHCVPVVQAVYAVSEPTCRALCNSSAGCLSNVRTYLPGTVLKWCRLFKQSQNLPAGHSVTVVQTV